MNTDYFHKDKYFDMVISACGLRSGKDRIDLIREIMQHNIWLAAKCKNTCINEEEEIVDEIILKCADMIEKSKDALSIIALLELEEYDVIYWLMTKYKKKNAPDFIMNLWKNKNTTVTSAFSMLAEDMPIDLSLNVFNKLIQLGYSLDQQPYNAIISKLTSNEERNNLINFMQRQGIEPNAETFFHLMRFSNTFSDALPYFELCNQCIKNDNYDNHTIIVNACLLMLEKSTSRDNIDCIYNTYCNDYGKNNNIELALAYYYKNLTYCNIYSDLINAWIECKKMLETIDYNKSIKKDIKKFVNTFLFKLYDLGYKHSIYNCLVEMSQLCLKIKCLKQVLVTNILKIISFTRFEKIQQLISTIINNGNSFENTTVFIALLTKVTCNEQLDYIFDKIKIKQLLNSKNLNESFSKNLHYTVKTLDANCVIYLYHLLQSKKYSMNVILYNAFIKRLENKDAIKVLKDMINENVKPDIFSISPLLAKWDTIDDLHSILNIASTNDIIADEMAKNKITQRINDLGCIPEIRMQLLPLSKNLEHSWVEVLERICAHH